MDNPPDLAAVRIPDDEVEFYHVSEGGWYAINDEDQAVLGPFESLGECDGAIRDRTRLIPEPPRSGSRSHVPWSSRG
jgi:hypothetical protein